MTTPELGQRLQAAMQEAEMSPTDLIELLLSFRGEDPNDRRAWERAKRAVARWRNGPSQSIQNDGERAFIERHLDLAEGHLVVQAVNAGLEETVARIEERLDRIEAQLDELRGRSIDDEQQQGDRR